MVSKSSSVDGYVWSSIDSVSAVSRPTRPKMYPLPAAGLGRGNLSNRFNTAVLRALAFISARPPVRLSAHESPLKNSACRVLAPTNAHATRSRMGHRAHRHHTMLRSRWNGSARSAVGAHKLLAWSGDPRCYWSSRHFIEIVKKNIRFVRQLCVS